MGAMSINCLGLGVPYGADWGCGIGAGTGCGLTCGGVGTPPGMGCHPPSLKVFHAPIHAASSSCVPFVKRSTILVRTPPLSNISADNTNRY